MHKLMVMIWSRGVGTIKTGRHRIRNEKAGRTYITETPKYGKGKKRKRISNETKIQEGINRQTIRI